MVSVLLLPWDFVGHAKTTISQEEDIFNHFLNPFLDKCEPNLKPKRRANRESAIKEIDSPELR
jgi:hypothetical protein